jgi:hypothetical protein
MSLLRLFMCRAFDQTYRTPAKVGRSICISFGQLLVHLVKDEFSRISPETAKSSFLSSKEKSEALSKQLAFN